MQFDSLAAALAMDGHGVYVWSVVVVSTLIVGALLLLPGLAARRFLADQRGALLRDAQRDPARDIDVERAAPEPAAPVAIIEEVNNASGS